MTFAKRRAERALFAILAPSRHDPTLLIPRENIGVIVEIQMHKSSFLRTYHFHSLTVNLIEFSNETRGKFIKKYK